MNADVVIRDYDFHPGEPHVRVFSYNRSSILRWDDQVFVGEALFDDVVLRHYAFRDEWFKINITTDRAGRIIEPPPIGDAPLFAFNCDIATPMAQACDGIHAVDLFADVLVRADGATFEVVDQVDLDQAVASGLVSPREHRNAAHGMKRLIGLIHERGLIPFLAGCCPFGESNAPPALPIRLVPIEEVPLVQARRRSSW